jgi:hypothetical protein
MRDFRWNNSLPRDKAHDSLNKVRGARETTRDSARRQVRTTRTIRVNDTHWLKRGTRGLQRGSASRTRTKATLGHGQSRRGAWGCNEGRARTSRSHVVAKLDTSRQPHRAGHTEGHTRASARPCQPCRAGRAGRAALAVPGHWKSPRGGE